MNRTKLKNYAPQARRDFIQAMTDRAAYYGLTATKTEPVVERGDVAVIAGREHPRVVAKKRKQLEDRFQRDGFEQTMEAMAYTWFNRLVAIRFMELHGYFEHGYRVLSHPEGKPTPQIIEEAEHVELPGLKQETVIDLKLAGNKEGELYRLLLTAQCNALHTAMPFLFEKIDDETELLLPDNLMHSDSLIRKLVSEIDEADWQEVEIIGWLYQFYISEKKDEVIGKVVASEDIPAATQLFTPNWIVKYLVQNTLGRQWLATYPQSALRQQMEYYIEPAEQTPEVQEQLKAITPISLNPEELTLLDPACGSGHILVEAYDLFKAIYQERGYRAKDIPALILQKNLFGLEIDDRAAQLAAFALMMKARADDRRIFDDDAKPNVLAFEESKGLNAAEITHALNSPILKEPPLPKEMLFEDIEEEKSGLFSKKGLAEKGHVSQADIASLLELFENAKTFGSLIQVPRKLAAKLPEIEKRLDEVLKHGDLTHALARVIKPLLHQAQLLVRQYDAVVANPPYMGSKYYSPTLKALVASQYENAKADLYSCFIQRNLVFARPQGVIGMITIPNWMFLSSFDEVRITLFENQTINSLIHNGRGVFGSDFGSCAFVLCNTPLPQYRGSYRRLFDKQGSVASNEELDGRFGTVKTYTASNLDFAGIPGSPVSYWISDSVRKVFEAGIPLNDVAAARTGMQTGENSKFIRRWTEVASTSCYFTGNDRSCFKWFPYNKGGDFRKWYGNAEFVVNWQNDGQDVKADKLDKLARGLCLLSNSKPKNQEFYFRECGSWAKISSSHIAVRFYTSRFLFDIAGCAVFADSRNELLSLIGFLNSVVAKELLSIISPTLNYQPGDIGTLPLITSALNGDVQSLVADAVATATTDWNSQEESWGFEANPLFTEGFELIQDSFECWKQSCNRKINLMGEIETTINKRFIEAYGLQDELSPAVSNDQITLYRPDLEEDIKRLISYAIGCMMGRYSLDKPGLIYAHSGNQGFDANQYGPSHKKCPIGIA